MKIYYDSKTGNVEEFLKTKVQPKLSDIELIKIDENTIAEEEGHLVTYTTGNGLIPTLTIEFLERSDIKKILTVSTSGSEVRHPDTHWFAGKKINKKYGIKLVTCFDDKGTDEDAENYVKDILNK